MTEHDFTFDTSVIHYVKAGHGERTLLFFHGFGQDNRVFEPFMKELSGTYTLYMIDLFFHGSSIWGHDEEPLKKDYWQKIVHAFLQKNNIVKFSLAGFSLGGKFVLATLERFPTLIEKIYLIAPDGIKTSFWYSLATYPNVLRKVFKSMIVHPNRFYNLVKLVNTLGLADKGLLRFAEHQMNTEEKRRRVYYSWVVFRHLQFNMDELADIINTQNIPVTMVVGKYDKVISVKNMNRLLKRLHNHRMEILEAGHNGLLKKENVKKIFSN